MSQSGKSSNVRYAMQQYFWKVLSDKRIRKMGVGAPVRFHVIDVCYVCLVTISEYLSVMPKFNSFTTFLKRKARKKRPVTDSLNLLMLTVYLHDINTKVF